MSGRCAWMELLQAWRGDVLDWATLREFARSECHEPKPTSAYTAGQWKRGEEARVCRECVRNHAANNTLWQCNVCKTWKQEDAFAKMYAGAPRTFYRVCHTCEAQKPCFKCGVRKPEAAFGAAAWKARRGPTCLWRPSGEHERSRAVRSLHRA